MYMYMGYLTLDFAHPTITNTKKVDILQVQIGLYHTDKEETDLLIILWLYKVIVLSDDGLIFVVGVA